MEFGGGSRNNLEACPTSAKTEVYVECALQIGLMSGSDMMIRRASCKQHDRRCKWKKVVMEERNPIETQFSTPTDPVDLRV